MYLLVTILANFLYFFFIFFVSKPRHSIRFPPI